MRNKKIFLSGVPSKQEIEKEKSLKDILVRLTDLYLKESLDKFKLIYETQPIKIKMNADLFSYWRLGSRILQITENKDLSNAFFVQSIPIEFDFDFLYNYLELE